LRNQPLLSRANQKVSEAVDEELRRLGGQVQESASSVGLDLLVVDHVAGETWQGPMLYRAGWMTPGADGPDVAIAIGWDGRKVQPTRGWPGVSLPYVGVVASHASQRGQRIEDAVRPIAKSTLVAPKAYLSGSHWIVYRFIEASHDWHSDLPAWRAWVVQQLIKTWQECAPVIEEGIASLTEP